MIWIGCSGWRYRDFVPVLYPPDLPQQRWFAHYAREFNTVEINSTFYHWPRQSTVKGWLSHVPEEFRFSIKVNRRITHDKRMKAVKTLVKDFCALGDLLGDRMGCFLFQMPPSFTYSPERLDEVLSAMSRPDKSVIEFRHQSWWDGRVFDRLRDAAVTFCSVSAPGLPQELICVAGQVYVRFHGVQEWYRGRYSSEQLNSWAQRIRACNCGQAWIYFNNTFAGDAVVSARQFRARL